MSRTRRTLLAGVLAVGSMGLGGCDPELPGRACSVDDDCFRDELCQGTSCVRGAREADPGPDDGQPDGGQTDSGADAEPDAHPDAEPD